MSQKNAKLKSGTSSIWGGRFGNGPSSFMEDINTSVDFDCVLYAQDISGSMAHCKMLVRQDIISEEDGNDILKGLESVLDEIESGKFEFHRSLEDVHMNIESRLTEIIGEAGGRLHTARSRNDQVATDLRLWVRDALDQLGQGIKLLQAALIDRAEDHADSVMPGFTHLQTAQPVTLGHHLLAYVEMLGRDRGRVMDCRVRLNQSPLGSAALAGTSFDIDRNMTAEDLGFDGPCANSLDGVSDRDFACEYLSLAAIIGIHLSRLAEEIVLWCSDQFGFARLSDELSTGSSIMPQKRNPDAAELVRAKTGRLIGDLNSLLVVMKGLPLAYAKDMQEDKEPVFDATRTLALSVGVMTAMINDISFDTKAMKADAGKGYACATDLADWLVGVLGMPFRKAHQVTGAIVKLAENKGCTLEELGIEDMQSVEPAISEEVFLVLGVENSVKSRTSFGGTAPQNVRAAITSARKRFLDI